MLPRKPGVLASLSRVHEMYRKRLLASRHVNNTSFIMTLEASDQLFSYLLGQLSAERDSFRSACKICGEATQLFDVVDLKKCCDRRLYPLGLAGIPIFYRSCGSWNFVFTTFFDDFNSDQWRLHIYNDEYAEVDPEYVDVRPRRNASEVQLLLAGANRGTIGLDYGGGNGQTATMLRKEGWNFDTYDLLDYQI